MNEDQKIPARHSVFWGVGGEHKVVKTYAGDVAEVIENDKEGLVRKIIHGEEQREKEKKNLSPKSRKNKMFMLSGFLLIVAAAIILFILFFKKDAGTVPVGSQFVPIIFNDRSSFFEISSLNKEEIVRIILGELNNTKVKEGGVEGIYLTENKKIIGLRRFISLIGSSFVPGENTFFVKNNFLLGVVNSGISAEKNREGFFVLLKVRGTADIFDALRGWEGKMLSDLSPFLGVNISSDTNYLFTKEFQDGIVNNKNARVLYDKNGKAVLMYIFADDNSVIISNSENAAREIMLRLASSRKKQ